MTTSHRFPENLWGNGVENRLATRRATRQHAERSDCCNGIRLAPRCDPRTLTEGRPCSGGRWLPNPMTSELPTSGLAEIVTPIPQVAELDPVALATLAKHGLLRALLRQVVLSQCLADEQLSDEERQVALDDFARARRLTSKADLERYQQALLLTPEALSLQVERPIRLQRHCQRLYGGKAEARFLERKTQLDRVVYSLVRVADEGLARELYLQLLDGEANFADLAATYSEGPERSTRGIVGPVPLTQAHPQLVQRLRTAPQGEVQEPFRIEQWWLVFRLESLTAASFDESMTRQMSQELFEQWLESEVESLMDRVRDLLQQSGVQGVA